MFEFINPGKAFDRSRFDAVAVPLGAPDPFDADDALTAHLTAALTSSWLEFDLRHHVNPDSGRPLQMISYYADDPDTVAWCASHDGAYLATIGIPFVRRLVKIAQHLEKALLPLDLSAGAASARQGATARDEVLTQLLSGEIAVSQPEALEIVAEWPAAGTSGAQVPLGAFALFYDLLRLVWLHEWAHALCGHAAVAKQSLGLQRLHEFSAERAGNALVDGFGYPRNEVFQAMEMHADEFATRYCVGEILWGRDPIGMLAGPDINLTERLVIFNLACSVFAVIWASAEQRYQPGMTFYPPRPPLASDQPEPLFVPFPTTHPPAAFRYMRFRNFEQDLSGQFARRNRGAEQLAFQVDARSFLILNDLAALDPRFYQLKIDSPGPSMTPEVKRLIHYETYLLEILEALAPLLEKAGFVPTVDPSTQGSGVAEMTSSSPMRTRELAQREPSGSVPAQRLSSAEFAQLFELAEQAYGDGALGDARDILHGLIVLDRQFTSAWALLGRVERNAGLMEDARAAFAFALARDPDNGDLAIELARVDQALRALR